MTITIGRFTNPSEVKRVSVSGDSVSLSFDIAATDANHAQALRQQLMGLVSNEDEEVVPVTWSLDSTFDGFYRVRSVNAGDSTVLISKFHWHEATVELERLTGYANPTFEVTVQSVVRTNAHGITAPEAVHTVGLALGTGRGSASEIDDPIFVSSTQRTSSDSSTSLIRIGLATAPSVLDAYRYAAYPDLFYYGAARLEILFGSTWYPMVGRDVPGSARWRITNGLIRLTNADGATAGTLEVWNGSAWESSNVGHYDTYTASAFGIGLADASTTPLVSVLRNSPEQVVVKVSIGILQVTYSLQRGAMLVVASWTALVARNFGAAFTTATASTALTGGIRATADDANGNRLVFALPAAGTSDLVNGYLTPTASAASGVMMLGVEYNGSSAGGKYTAADIVEQFMGAVSWRQRVIVR